MEALPVTPRDDPTCSVPVKAPLPTTSNSMLVLVLPIDIRARLLE